MRPEEPKRKLSIYVGSGIQAAFAAIIENDELTGFNRSGRLNSIAERYMTMIDAAMPKLAAAEWLAIFDANITTESPATAHAHANLWDYPYTELGKKWDIDARELVSRLEDLPLASRLAVAEVIDRWWGGAHRLAEPDLSGHGNTRKALLRAGAKIKEDDDGTGQHD